MRSLTSSRSRYTINEDGIIIQEGIKEVYIDLEVAKEEVAVFIQLTAGKKYPLLIMANNKGMSREAQQYYRSDFLGHYGAAVALYTHSKLTRMIGSFYLGWYPPPYPFKIFDDKKKALEWLKKYVEK